jgi:hypothetical protein
MRANCGVRFDSSRAIVRIRAFDVVLGLGLSARYKGTIITTQYELIQLPKRGISCNSGLISMSDAFIDVFGDCYWPRNVTIDVIKRSLLCENKQLLE